MKYFALVLFIYCYVPAFSQSEKGSTFLGIQAGCYVKDSFLDNHYYKHNSGYSATLAYGKTTAQNVVSAVQLTYGHSIYDDRWELFGYSRYELGIGYLKRYYRSLGKNVYIWLQAGVNYTRNWQIGLEGKSWGAGFPHDYWGNAISLVAYPGFSYRINKNIQIEASYRNLLSLYASDHHEYIALFMSPKVHYYTLGLEANKNLPLAWQLGFRVFIAKKNKFVKQ